MWRRIRATSFELEQSNPPDTSEDGEGAVIAIDATGMKVARRGDWIRKKWKVKKGWLKVHISVEVKTKSILLINIANQPKRDGNPV